MSLENKTYFEGNEMVPMLPKKIKRGSQFRVEKENFPEMNKKEENQNSLEVYQRRDRYRQEGQETHIMKPYRPRKKGKLSIQNNQGYDRKEYNKYLVSPNGRYPSEEYTGNCYKTRDTDSMFRTREDKASKTADIIKVAEFLPLQERILNYMTQLESINIEIFTTDQDEARLPKYSAMEY